MTSTDYVKRRLDRMVGDALADAQERINKVRLHAAEKGVLQSSVAHGQMEKAAAETTKEWLERMAQVTFTLDGQAAQMEAAARNLAGGVVDLLRDYSERGALAEYAKVSVDKLETKLSAMVSEVVVDFQHEMVGEQRLKKDPVVSSITMTVTNSPGAVIQNAVGQHNHQSVEQQQVLSELASFINSEEVRALPEEQRVALQDVADVLHAEITKPNADESRVARWGRHLLNLAEQFGLQVAASGVAKNLFG